MRKFCLYTLLIACVALLVPATFAQLGGMAGDNADPFGENDNTIGQPTGPDNVCDDENSPQILRCEITKVTTDLDSAIPTATFWGEYCESPVVTIGQADGTFALIPILGAGVNFITVDLTGNDAPMDVMFEIACPCGHRRQGPAWDRNCDALVTIGAVGPTGATGPQGPQGKLGPAGADGEPGATGPTGPKGAKGSDGSNGAQGPQGKQGEPGATGPTGPTGPTGSKGNKGGDDGGGETACDCCDKVSQGTPGCSSCAPCEDTVCAVEPFCCVVVWDSLCDSLAASMCTCCPGQTPGVCE